MPRPRRRSARAAPSDPVSALSALLAPGGTIAAACRFCYELRLHRARGYGALKAILDVLAEEESLTLTEIALRLQRTPGSTKDYLSWLEDVDLIVSRQKRYSFADPMLRLWVRLHCHATPPTEEDIAREVHAYVLRAAAAARAGAGDGRRVPAAEATATNRGGSSRSIDSETWSPAFERQLRRRLRRFLLALPFGLRQRFAVDQHFDVEHPPVRRPDLGGEAVRGRPRSCDCSHSCSADL